MVKRYFDGVIPSAGEYSASDKKLIAVAASASSKANEAIDRTAITEAIISVWTLVDELNNYITTEEPWVLAKDESNRDRLETVLYCAAEGLRALTVLLSPVMPKATAKLWAALTAGTLGDLAEQNISEAGSWGQLANPTVGDLDALFPRIESKDE